MKSQIDEYLIALYREHGMLTPEMVVADAANPESPLHAVIEQDDAKAAHQHRLDRARELIRGVKVLITNETKVLRAPFFVRDPSLPAQKQGYVVATSLRSESDLAMEAVLEELARASSAFRRAEAVAAAVGVQADVEGLLRATLAVRDRVLGKGAELAE